MCARVCVALFNVQLDTFWVYRLRNDLKCVELAFLAARKNRNNVEGKFAVGRSFLSACGRTDDRAGRHRPLILVDAICRLRASDLPLAAPLPRQLHSREWQTRQGVLCRNTDRYRLVLDDICIASKHRQDGRHGPWLYYRPSSSHFVLRSHLLHSDMSAWSCTRDIIASKLTAAATRSLTKRQWLSILQSVFLGKPPSSRSEYTADNNGNPRVEAVAHYTVSSWLLFKMYWLIWRYRKDAATFYTIIVQINVSRMLTSV